MRPRGRWPNPESCQQLPRAQAPFVRLLSLHTSKGCRYRSTTRAHLAVGSASRTPIGSRSEINWLPIGRQPSTGGIPIGRRLAYHCLPIGMQNRLIMATPIRLLAVDQLDERLPRLRDAAQEIRRQAPREGWIKAIRNALGMSERSFA